MDLGKMRVEYGSGELRKEEMEASPLKQFEKWFEAASAYGIHEPNAMSLSTVGLDGQPSIRTVLLKHFDEQGFVFYTNYESRKSKEIQQNPKAAILFPWITMERQVIIMGTVSKVSQAESLKYFLSRPFESQVGAWISNQSSVVSSRKLLMMKFEEMKQKFKDGKVPLPSHWGGYRVVPHRFEFWQGQKSRLHDRFQYTAIGDNREWVIERLAP